MKETQDILLARQMLYYCITYVGMYMYVCCDRKSKAHKDIFWKNEMRCVDDDLLYYMNMTAFPSCVFFFQREDSERED